MRRGGGTGRTGASAPTRPPAGTDGRVRPRPLPAGAALFVFLLSVYLLNFSGRPHSSDGIAMLATTESLVRRIDLDMNAYLWMGLQQGSFGPDGDLYSRKGVGQVLASLPLAWLGLQSHAVGLVQVAMLLSPLVAAATALCLYAAVLMLGYGSDAALAVGLIYGLATPALPYSKYSFSDPLTGLALFAGFLALLRYRQRCSRASAAACGALLGFAVLTRTTSLALVPLYALGYANHRDTEKAHAVILSEAKNPSRKRGWLSVQGILWAFGPQNGMALSSVFSAPLWLPFLAFLVLTGLFNYLRFGSPLVSGYLPQESFNGDWLAGIAGLLVSPGRGLFLYAPVLLAAIPGWLLLRRRDAVAAWLCLGVAAAHVLIYGKWFMWHGGYAWGPRFLLPALPFLALALAPLWERRRWRPPLLGLATLSFVPQLLGSLVHFAPFQDDLLRTGLPLYAPETFWQPRYSPLLGQWRYVRFANLDFAWAQAATGAPRLDVTVLLALVASAALAGLALWAAVRARGRLLLPLAGVVLAATTALALVHAHRAGQHPLDAPLRLVEAGERAGDALLLARPDDSLSVSDRYKGRLPAYGPAAEQVLPGCEAAAEWLPRLGERYQRLWLLGQQAEWESWLAGWGYQMRQEAGEGWRLALYARPSGELRELSREQAFRGGIVLAEASVALEGEMLFARLRWRAEQPISTDYKVFLHAFAADGTLLAQHDAVPDLWRRPTTGWQVGETVEDRHGLLLPAGARVAYLLVGLYDPASGARLAPLGGGDSLRLDVEYGEAGGLRAFPTCAITGAVGCGG